MKRFLGLFLAILMVFAAMPVGLAEANDAAEPVDIPVVEEIVDLGSPDSTDVLTEDTTPEPTAEPTAISTEEDFIDQESFEAGLTYSLRVADTLEITAHPANVSAKTGASVSFSVSAQGSNLSYQWQTLSVGSTNWVNTGMAGNKTTKITFTTTAALDGRQYRCAVSDGSKTVYSNPATLTLTDVLKITAQPASVSAKTGASVSFTVSAQGSNLSYQWQTLEVGKTTWVNTGMSGNKTAKITFTTTAALDGRQYRCAVSDGSKTVYSNPAKLTLTDVLNITAQPANVSAKTGASVSFMVSAQGSNLSYQWQTLAVGTTNWVNTGMSGNKTAKITFTTTTALDGRQYRCAVSDGSKTVYSNPAKLTLTDVLNITAQPANVSAKTGASVSFSVSAQGSNLSYQWQTLSVGSTNWVNTGMSGNKTAKITFTTSTALDGRQYRCAVSDGSKTVYSNPAKLTLTDVLNITAQPANVSAKTGASVSFSVSAQGSNLSYQWQTLSVGSTNWVNTGMSGNKTAKITFTTTAALDGRQYRCAVSDGSKTVYSNPAKLTLTDVLNITAQPANVSAKTGASVSFSVSAQGSNLSYQWQTLSVGSTNWVNTGMSGNKTAKITFTTTTALDGRQYRCAVSSGSKTVYSDSATLTLTDMLKITANPANVSAKTGASVSFTVSAQGSNLSYQWQTLAVGSTNWVNTGMSGNKTAKITFTTTAALDGRQYRCAVSDGSKTVYSNPATLTLTDMLKITAHPANVSAKTGASVSFSVSAQGSNLSYQWQTLSVGSTNWVNTGMSGNKTAKITFTTTTALDGRQYRCAVSNGSKTVYSDSATLTLTDMLKITAHPVDVSAKTGASVSFTVSAQGSNLSYQWQTLAVGTTNWVNTGMSGNKTAKITFTTVATLDGRQYRCAISDGSKTIYSDPATLTLTDVLGITAHPANVSAKVGNTVTFTVSAKGSNLSYQWQTLTVGSTNWVNTGLAGNKTAKLSFTPSAALDGRQYRCAVSDGSKTVYSDPAKLTLTDVTSGKETTELYDAQGNYIGKEVSYTDSDGTTITEYYNALGIFTGKDVVSIGADGVTTELSYDAQGYLTGKYILHTDANEITTQKNYDAQGNYLGTYICNTAADGERIVECYDAQGNYTKKFVTHTDAAGTTTQKNYDAQGNYTGKTVKSVGADGKETYQFFNAQGSLTGKNITHIDADGKTTVVRFDTQDNFINQSVVYKDADGKDIEEEYNAQGKLSYKSTTGADGITVDERYDTQGNITQKNIRYTDADGKETTEWYDAQGNYTGKNIHYYDADGKWVQELFDDQGKLTTIFYTGADGKEISEHYDAQGNYTGKNVSYYDAEGKDISESYDAQGNYTGKYINYKDAEGKDISESYDAQGNYTGKFSFYDDADGNSIYESYDAQGKLTFKSVNSKRIYEVRYDANGNLNYKCIIDADGKEISEHYDDQGNLKYKYVTYTDADGKRVEENYDAQGNYTGKNIFYTDADGKETTEWYDAQGNYTGKNIHYYDADGKWVQELFDAQGNLIYKCASYKDADGKEISENYDAEGNYTGKDIFYYDADGKWIQECYDTQGNYTGKYISYQDANGNTIHEDYDAEGNLTSTW